MDRKLILDFDKKQKQQKRQKSKQQAQKDHQSGKKRFKKDEDEPPTSSSTAYRDRAKERREGLNRDFEIDPDDLMIASNPVIDGDQEEDEAELRLRQIEESKYLGGDVEHTHLVKGVDFALLEKTKSAMKLAESKELCSADLNDDANFILAGSDSDEEEFTREALKAATTTGTNRRQIDLGKLRKSQMIQCRHNATRRILDVLDDDRASDKREKFQASGTSYVFSLDLESDTQVTTVVRSKAEQAERDPAVSEKDLAFDILINIFAKIRNKKS